MKDKGPDMKKWNKFRHGDNELNEHFLGVKTMKPINRNAPEIQENAKKSVVQIEKDLEKIFELLKFAKDGLNEGKVPDSTTGNAIMQLASRIGAVAGQMWK